METRSSRTNSTMSLSEGKLTQAKQELTQAEEKLMQAKQELTQAEEKLMQAKQELMQAKQELTQAEQDCETNSSQFSKQRLARAQSTYEAANKKNLRCEDAVSAREKAYCNAQERVDAWAVRAMQSSVGKQSEISTSCLCPDPPSTACEKPIYQNLFVEFPSEYFAFTRNAAAITTETTTVRLDTQTELIDLTRVHERARKFLTEYSSSKQYASSDVEAAKSAMFSCLLDRFLFPDQTNTGFALHQMCGAVRQQSSSTGVSLIDLSVLGKTTSHDLFPVLVGEVKLRGHTTTATWQTRMYFWDMFATQILHKFHGNRPMVGLWLSGSNLGVEVFMLLDHNHFACIKIAEAQLGYAENLLTIVYALVHSLLKNQRKVTLPPCYGDESLWGTQPTTVRFSRSTEHSMICRVMAVDSTIRKRYHVALDCNSAPWDNSFEQGMELVTEYMTKYSGFDANQITSKKISADCFVLEYPYARATQQHKIGHFVTLYQRVQTLHKNNLVHGDIRLSNFVFATDTAYLIDMDFVGQHQSSYYPSAYANVDGVRHENALAGALMLIDHDLHSLWTIMCSFEASGNETVWAAFCDAVKTGDAVPKEIESSTNGVLYRKKDSSSK